MYKASANLYAKVSFASETYGAGNERKGVLDEESGWKSKRLIRVPCVRGCACVVCWQEGNTEEENNGYVVFKWNILWRLVGGVTPPLTLFLFAMLLHNGGFCNPTALQNGARTYQCIFKQMYCKTTFSHNGYMKSLKFLWKLHHSFLSIKKLFYNIITCMTYYPKRLK